MTGAPCLTGLGDYALSDLERQPAPVVVEFRAEDPSPAAGEDLARLGDGLDGWYRGEVEAGRAGLCGAWEGGERVGTLVYRVEGDPRVLAVLAAAGRAPDLVRRAQATVDAMARSHGCVEVRLWAPSAIHVRLYRRAGFAVVDIGATKGESLMARGTR